jgi:hypothetical protein
MCSFECFLVRGATRCPNFIVTVGFDAFHPDAFTRKSVDGRFIPVMR